MKKIYYILIVIAVLVATYFLWPRPDPVTPPGSPTSVTPKPPIVERGTRVVVSDSSGSTQSYNVDTETEVEAVATVSSDSTKEDVHVTARLNNRGWLPGIFNRPDIILETLHRDQADRVFVTYQPDPILDFEPNSLSIGVAQKLDITYASVAWTPIKIWALHFGVSAYANTSSIEAAPVGQVEIRDRLFLTIGHNIESTFIGINYRF